MPFQILEGSSGIHADPEMELLPVRSIDLQQKDIRYQVIQPNAELVVQRGRLLSAQPRRDLRLRVVRLLQNIEPIPQAADTCLSPPPCPDRRCPTTRRR